MSAREELYAALMKGGPHSPDRSEKASYLIDNLLHEEAEKIRRHAEPKSDRVYAMGAFVAADMIDPYAK
ncbi:hypothetical protein OG306_33300 [Streptomyces sp. NBC_01241]|uniref:hypothetical protein n=1 Tax=Streptomyces sp. NBC_01241 TaxID=2903794 RepID=UPI00352E6BCF|nr:hypothetical protein OG306_33300 [Streptomyces sp. NBC_01241]